ncbi:MAG: hypothetical protein KatS3mg032_0388 [Cyclobacteriaceae bacterium]|nr:MAG: hypothetical protein KatS3mg032_0388 [Cyclobacteriaceae bacterium]
MRSISLFLLLASVTMVAAQKRKPPSSFNRINAANTQFLEKQWWLGLKAGVSFSGTVVQQPYSGLSPVNYTAPQKNYDNFAQPGFVVLMEAAFSYRRFTVAFQPGYRNARFDYQTFYLWTDYQNPDNRLELQYGQQQRVEYADFPLLVRFDATTTRLRPYIQAGVYYAHLIQAAKTIQVTGTDYASGGINVFAQPPVKVGATELFATTHYGLIAGAGASLHSGNVRFSFDIQYRKGMSLANSTSNRYANTRLNSFGDVMDDIHINSVLFSLGTIFPLKFLSKSFQSVTQRP